MVEEVGLGPSECFDGNKCRLKSIRVSDSYILR